MIAVRYKEETREIEPLRSGKVVRGEVGDRVLTENGIEMIVDKNHNLLITVCRDKITVGDNEVRRILRIRRNFSDKCHRYYRLIDPQKSQVFSIYEEGTNGYNTFNQKLKTPWGAAA